MTTSMEPGEVLRRRLGVQRLASAGLARGADVVRLLACAQSQEHPHALWSLGMRTAGATFAGLQAEFDSGAFLRTHILRPTWHYVAPEDLRWILELTSPRVLSGLRGHFAKQGLDAEVAARGADVLRNILAGRNALTRKEIGVHMAAAGLPGAGLALGDLLLMNEMSGVIVSGPMKGAQHTHVLVDEVVAPAVALARDEALGRLAHRFFAGHGPASLKDMCRWASLTQADVKRGIEVAGAALECVDVNGVAQWFDPAVPHDLPPAGAADDPAVDPVEGAFLTPSYDEAVLTYPWLGFPVLAGHPRGPAADPNLDPYAANVIVGLANAGTWKRRITANGVEIELRLASSISTANAALVDAAADRLAAFLALPRLPALQGQHLLI